MTFINDLIQYSFLQKAMLTAVFVGIISGVIGSFIILRGMALMGDAISHAILPGVVISYMLGINYIFGAVVMGLVTSFLISNVSNKTKLKNDVSIGVVFSSFFALGIVLLLKAQAAVDLTQILFGNVLTVSDSDMYMTLVIGVLVLLTVYLLFKELVLTSFDPLMAKAYGMNVGAFDKLLMLLLTLVTVASLQTVGVILVVSMLITPAATAYLICERMKVIVFMSGVFGALSAALGLMISFKYNLSSGAVIVLVSAAFFTLAYLFSPKEGLLNRRDERKALQE